MSDLSGLVSLITGAGSGIGRAAALRMAECGSAIMCADIDHAAAQDTAAQVAEHGGRSAAMHLDVSDEAAVKAALRKTVDELGGLYKAIDLAKQRARIPADEEVDLVVYPPHRSVYEVLADQLATPVDRMRAAYTSDALLQLLGPRERRALSALLAPSRLFRSGQVLAHMPYVFVR